MEVLIRKQEIDDYDCLSAEKLGINKDLVSIDDLLGIIEDLYYEVERLKEELQDTINDRDSNYKPISNYEMYGMSDRDFF